MFPTPSARDWKSGNASPETMEKNSRPLNEAVTQGAGGQLNPRWVAWLMGWPIGWTDLKPLATDKYPSAPHSRFDCWREMMTRELEDYCERRRR